MNLKSAILNVRFFFWWFRQVLGDAAYENYVCSARSGGSPLMSREEFFLDSLRRRYSSVSRCC
jgi:uncharacterized short protein YbdD (DUF466 family)